MEGVQGETAHRHWLTGWISEVETEIPGDSRFLAERRSHWAEQKESESKVRGQADHLLAEAKS